MDPFRRAATRIDSGISQAAGENIPLLERSRRCVWFMLLRALTGIVLGMIALFQPFLLPHLAVSWTVFAVATVAVLSLDGVFWLHYRYVIHRGESAKTGLRLARNVHVQVIVDILVLAVLCYQCGGMESPLPYYFLFHCTLSCLFFRRRQSFAHTALSVLLVAGIEWGMAHGFLPPRHFLDGMGLSADPHHMTHPGYGLAGLAALYFGAWYLIASITFDLKKQELALQQKVDELVRMNQERTRYMLVTTHELKAPFTAIQSYVNVALGGYAGEVSEKLKGILGRIHERCTLVSKMITDMIQLANIVSQREKPGEVALERLELWPVVEAAVARFETPAKDKGLHFELELEPPAPHLLANREQLEILLNNVLSNAVSYARKETAITITVKTRERRVQLSVADRGIGIKPEFLEKVFLEYFREERAVAVNRNSTGLGLTIVRTIMDIHQGRVWIESEVNVGTTVHLEFNLPNNQA